MKSQSASDRWGKQKKEPNEEKVLYDTCTPSSLAIIVTELYCSGIIPGQGGY